MDKQMDRIKELVSEFAGNMGPVFDNWDDESQGMSIEEKFWVLGALIFFRSYIEGPLTTVNTPVPSYEDREPSPIMRTLKKQMKHISIAIVRHAEQRENETKISNLQEQLEKQKNRVKQLKNVIIELRDQTMNVGDDSFVHVAPGVEPVNELGLFYRLFKKSG